MELNWRSVLMFSVALACAITALVAAGLSEQADAHASAAITRVQAER